MSHQVHLVGSVPLADARAVFATVSAALGPHLKSIPDGETGERLDWITWLEPVFADIRRSRSRARCSSVHAALDAEGRALPAQGRRVDRRTCASTTCSTPTTRASPTRCSSDSKRQGKIPPHVKFQVDLVPAHSVIWLLRQEDLHAAVDKLFNDAVQARDRQDRGGDPARPARDPVRHGVGGVRAARAQSAVELRHAPRPRCRRPSAAS